MPAQGAATVPPAAEAPVAPPARPRPAAAKSGSPWGSAVLIGLGVLSFVFVAWLYVHDGDPRGDEDLIARHPVDQALKVSSIERMRILLSSLQPPPPGAAAIGPPWAWDTPMLSEFLALNGRAMDNLKDLLEDEDWHGRHAIWYETDLGKDQAWTTLGLLKQAEAAYLERRGEEEAAFTAAIDLAELASRMQEIEAWPSYYLGSREIHMRCVQITAHLLGRTKLSAVTLRAFQEFFDACRLSDERLKADLIPAFYLHEKKLLLGGKSGAPLDTLPGGVQFARPGRLFFKVNETLDYFADTFRLLRARVGIAFSDVGSQLDLRDEAVTSRSAGYYQPNGAGEAYFARRIEPYLDIPAQHQLACTRHALVMQLFAIRRFVADQHRLPATLAELTPRYLPDLPIDPYAGNAPYHYQPARGVLYSLGTDYADESGRMGGTPLADDKEPTVELGFGIARAAAP